MSSSTAQKKAGGSSPTKAAARRPPGPSLAYAPGARVEIRGEEWIIRRAQQTSAGTTAVHVSGLSELVRDKDAIFLDDLDAIRVLRPEDTEFVADPSPEYRRSKLYLESLLRQTPPTGTKLSVGHRGAINVAPYQLVPAARALGAPRPRLLLADGVGLGKTIEVGILLSELIRRGRGRRILVVALKSVLEQFQKELWARFTLPLVRLDSLGLERVQRQIPANHNPFYRFDRVIISVDTLKKDEKYRRFLEKCHWDAIVIDECQHVAERGGAGPAGASQRSRLARSLAHTCDALILTSATPHDGSPESFASLMNLLDPTAVADPEHFTREDVEHLYVRRFKKDVAHESAGSFSERELHPQHIAASPEENAVFDALGRATFATIHPRLPGRRGLGDAAAEAGRADGVSAGVADSASASGHSALFRTLLLKSFLSSPSALAATLGERLKRQQSKRAALEREGRLSAELEQAYRADQRQLEALARLTEQVSPARNTKLKALLGLLEPLGLARPNARERVVVFSERIPTLEFLQAELGRALGLRPEQIGVFHGSLDDQEQQELVRSFGTEDSPVRVLLASDAASEGINLHHFCHRMVHYDIPWSLITLEQRNGRIDRYGQRHRPELHYLLSVPGDTALRGDLRVLEVLVEKEHAAHQNLGDVRWLMGLSDPAEEEARVIEGVSRHESAESILTPPVGPAQQLSLLERLMAASAPSASAGSATGRDEAALPETEAPFRLYPDDLSYMKAAFDELLQSQAKHLPDDQRLQPPEWHEHIAGFSLHAPLDLQQRYAYLPSELKRGGNWTFTLSADREQVQKSLAVAREKSGAWPELELLWELHPIAGWINDRVLRHFGRHEAPVIRIPQGLSPGEWVYVFQGVLSNQHSQPVLVDWFGVRTGPSQSGDVISLRDLSALVGLDGRLVNGKEPVDAAALRKYLEGAVSAADEHMKTLRQRRAKQLTPELKRQQQRLQTWESARKDLHQRRVAESHRNGRGSSSAQRAAWQEYQEHTDRVVRDRKGWLDRLKTSDTPYLRLALVIGAAPAKGKR